jgi:hypothetical protein
MTSVFSIIQQLWNSCPRVEVYFNECGNKKDEEEEEARRPRHMIAAGVPEAKAARKSSR